MMYLAYVVNATPPAASRYRHRVKIRCPELHGLDPQCAPSEFSQKEGEYVDAKDLPWVSYTVGDTFEVGDIVYLETNEGLTQMTIQGKAVPASESGMSDGGIIFQPEGS